MQAVDWQRWIKLDAWTILEAGHLLENLEPAPREKFRPNDRNAQPIGSPARRAAEMYHRIKMAADAGALQFGKSPEAVVALRRVIPSEVVAWARGKGDTIPPELDRAFPLSAMTGAPLSPLKIRRNKGGPEETQPAESAEDSAMREKLTPKSPGGKLVYQSWDALQNTFMGILDGPGHKIDWRKASEQNTKGGAHRLALARREMKDSKTYSYDPESVGLWLHYARRANLRKIADALTVECGRQGIQHDGKAAYWRGVSKSGSL